MDFVLDQLKFLGLNKNEVQVFTAIATFGRMNMTKISSYSNLPRTTVDAIVRRLVKQGLVFKKRIGKHNEYYVDLNEMANKLNWIEKRLRSKKEEYVCNTKDELKGVCSLHAGDRAHLLLSYGDGNLKKNVDRFVFYSKVIAENNMKFEVMLCSATANAVRDNKSSFTNTMHESLILNIVPTSYCNALTDVFVFRDKILLTNLDKKEVKIFDDKNIVELNKHLIKVASEVGWSISLNSWLNAV